MAFLGPALSIIGTVVSVVSAFSSAREEEQQGSYNAQVYQQTAQVNALGQEHTAERLLAAAGRERASSQREALEERRRAQLAASRATALAGASGGGISDPTVVRNVAELEAVGRFNALTALYEGDERAIGLEDEARMAKYGAEVTRYEGAVQGAQEKREAGIRAKQKRREGVASLISGAGSLYSSLSQIGGGSFGAA